MVHVTCIEREVEPHVVEALQRKLKDPKTSLAQRYRVLFSLRNIQGSKAHAAMLEGECFANKLRKKMLMLTNLLSTGFHGVQV